MRISQDTLDILIDIVLYSMVAFPPWLVVLMILTWICPKSLNERYFKSPHFSEGEQAAYINFPLTHFKMLIFVYALASPKRYHKRKMTEIRGYVPRWYFCAAMTWLVGLILISLCAVCLMIILIIYIEYFHNAGG
jgi:hypothetical protein